MMSAVETGEDNLPSENLGENETPRKRMRLDNPSRKGWSLMDKRTDQEVLQEMGVSLLEPDETELDSSELHHKPPKRKRNIENVNPNVNLMSPRARGSPSKSPRGKCSPIPGPSKGRSPRSSEKSKPLQPTENLEYLLNAEYQIDEETPLGQSVSADYRTQREDSDARREHTIQEDVPRSLRLLYHPATAGGPDAFAALSDEVVLGVLRWLPKRALAHCMTVCKRWYRVACDETLWQRLDLGCKVISKGALGRILSRKPLVLRLANSELGEWYPTAPPSPCRLQYLDLSMAALDTKTLQSLLVRCPSLKKLSLEGVTLKDDTCEIIGKCSNLETLNLTMAHEISATGVIHILKGCSNLQSLNISWCNLCPAALQALVTQLPQRLRRLNIAGAKLLSDDMVTKLVARVPTLVELDLSDCSRLGVGALTAVMTMARLEHLALSRCYLLPPACLTKLGSMPSLQYLEVWGMLQTGSLNALRAALPAIQLNNFMFSRNTLTLITLMSGGKTWMKCDLEVLGGKVARSARALGLRQVRGEARLWLSASTFEQKHRSILPQLDADSSAHLWTASEPRINCLMNE